MPQLLAATPDLLARAAEETAGVLYITDLEHRIVWVNAAFVRAFGYAPQEALGQVPAFLLDLNGDDGIVRDIIGTLDRGERVSTSLVFRRKDGTTFWTALAVAPLLDAEGQRVGYLSNCIDISPTKAAEQRLANILAGTRAGTWEWD